MRILVIGGNGFIGSHIVDALIAAKTQVSVLDMFPEKYRQPLEGVTYFQGSFGDADALEAALSEKPETVLHLATYGLSIGASGLPESDIRNLNDSVKLFEACIRHGVKKILFMSTGGKIYGLSDKFPLSEDSSTNPLGSYGITKLATEKFLLSLAHDHGFTPVIVRPSNPYGPRQAPTGVQGAIPIFTWRILHQQPITIWGAGDAVRDYIDVKDVASFCAMAATQECSGVYNLGSGSGISTLDLVDAISDVLQIAPIVQREPARGFDLPAVVLDSTRAMKQFSWNPQTDLRKGLVEVVGWLSQLAKEGSR